MTLNESSDEVPPVWVFCWKQAAGLKGHLVRAVSCSLPWMYMLCPQPGEVTIRGLFTGEFSLAWERRIQRHHPALVCHRLLLPPRPDALPPKWWWRATPSVMLWIFTGKLFSLARKQRAAERLAWLRRLSLLCDSWRGVRTGCQSFIIWAVLFWPSSVQLECPVGDHTNLDKG